jgi:hypothetical protein
MVHAVMQAGEAQGVRAAGESVFSSFIQKVI